MARIKKGDTVTVLSGKNKGKTGKILQVWPGEGRALVERLNLSKHYERRSQQNPAGGIVERESPIAISKLALACPKCQKPVRVGYSTSETSGKQRICRSCGGSL
ncbi:MAG: 50S ribosomal protein L24 [Candidatus Omnitrophica bacterium]|nr:50S ribosomal protein L24 [Candidatus Omnitrophota bacterium]MBI2174068.1 50S ribosomal protein L24 [Candidatus Omnitrophota bacterium]MBI3010663.1 50S ribosomal protein L24 [Candidatus Omnitrophota bacterium]